MAISDAVGLARISTILGYKIDKGNFATQTPNLPQRILVLGVANDANDGTITHDVIERHNTADEVGKKYGYGSPMHLAMRILKPSSGIGVGGIPVLFSAQAPTGDACVKQISVTGTATKGGSATVIIGGRNIIDGDSYSFNYSLSDSSTIVATAIKNAINGVKSCPYIATSTAGDVTLTAKFKGLNSDIKVRIDFGDNANGITYATSTITASTGAPTVTTALQAIGNEWVTMVINTYSPTSTAVLNEFQIFNGHPGVTSTGRYSGVIMKPFIAFTGVCTSAEKSSASTYAQANDDKVTNAFAPAYGSEGICFEASANYGLIEAVIAQNTPHLDIINRKLVDMPAPDDMSIAKPTYDERDVMVKDGLSTVVWDGGEYIIKDFVTTYHSADDDQPIFRYVRDLYVDFNMKFAYFIKQNKFVVGKIIVPDDGVPASGVSQDSIMPKTWKALVMDLIEDFANRGMLVDVDFTKQSLQVEINATNPNRLDTAFNYKRSGIARIGSTNVFAGFYFGEN